MKPVGTMFFDIKLLERLVVPTKDPFKHLKGVLHKFCESQFPWQFLSFGNDAKFNYVSFQLANGRRINIA